MSIPALQTVLKTMATIYERSCFPDDPENAADADFQAGYAEGLKQGDRKKLSDPTHPINLEFERRSRVNDVPFQNWKRGYWVGVYTHMMGGKAA